MHFPVAHDQMGTWHDSNLLSISKKLFATENPEVTEVKKPNQRNKIQNGFFVNGSNNLASPECSLRAK